MSFIRPELQASLIRWREVLVGGGVACVGVYFTLSGYSVHVALGVVLIGLGAVIAWIGYRRLQFAGDGGGLGVVELNERLISYFAPQGGRAVSIDDLTRVELVATPRSLMWHLHSSDHPVPLIIPNNAEGTACMFDILSALSGADYKTAMAAMTGAGHETFVIWQKSTLALH
ncbi:hypothetical protein [Parasulfitobacter algicola]|uniref:Uncharacterized protein n=1 Tax=Parasulfitobacter algicola TaxID=2614809 RepID=A0ABX2ITF9_9RHOB|nr:hypothetical protein [Sulfitobacter algicola]NSX56192.1 hypothetical protein [Sulfitobacter algicola]